ncbi:hypothetical protein LPJ61_003067, partial [Coemansia biformis]
MVFDSSHILTACRAICDSLGGFFRDPAVLWILITVAVGAAGFRAVYALCFSPLRRIPGPLLARLTSMRIEMAGLTGTFAAYGKKGAEQYGDIYVCHPSGVCITDPADIRQVLSSSLFLKGPYYSLLRITGIDNAISVTHPEGASRSRRMLGPFFSTSYISRMEPLIAEYGMGAITRRWDALLGGSSDGTTTVNYGLTFSLCTFNVISRLVYGQDIAALDPSSSGESFRWVHQSTNYISIRTLLQLLPRLLFRLLTWPWEHLYRRFSDHVHESIDARKQLLASLGAGSERPADLLQALLDCEDPKSRVRLTSEQIHAESLLLLLGGTDPTAFSLIWAMHLLMLYPECRRRATREVRSNFPPSDETEITYAAARSALPYLEACILESMRLVPVPSVMIPRVVRSPGATIKGHYLPPGTHVFANIYGSH